MKYLIYDTSTGRITHMIECPESHIGSQAATGESYVASEDGVSDKTHYVDSSQTPKLRPDTPCTADVTAVPADAATLVTISGLAADTEITIAGPVSDTFTATGSVELTFAVPGTYTIAAEAAFPATRVEHKVSAT